MPIYCSCGGRERVSPRPALHTTRYRTLSTSGSRVKTWGIGVQGGGLPRVTKVSWVTKLTPASYKAKCAPCEPRPQGPRRVPPWLRTRLSPPNLHTHRGQAGPPLAWPRRCCAGKGPRLATLCKNYYGVVCAHCRPRARIYSQGY